MFDSGLDVAPLEEAVRDGHADVAGVAREVGARAARLGVPLHEVLDHVERAHGGREPSFAAARAAAVAWAEDAVVLRVDHSCEDPLTTLTSPTHLRTRLAEAYRGAERDGHEVREHLVLVVVELPRALAGHDLESSLRALDLADALRTVFAGDETLARLSPRRFAALARHEQADALALRLLARLLERALGADTDVRLWAEQLPASADAVPRVLAALSE